MTYSKILLALLPWWTPLIPPQGISRLKGYLQQHGYQVKTVDLNLEYKFKKLYDGYFNALKSFIPEYHQGNIYNIGNDVWRDHHLAHINYEDENKYIELVKIIIYKIFYWHLQDHQVMELKKNLDQFYATLGSYILDLLQKEKPDVLGISVYRDTLAPSMFAFRLAKRKYPGLLTVMGGAVFNIHLPLGSPNLNLFKEKTRDYIDKFIVGEGEILFLKLLRRELPESQRLFTRKDIGGQLLGFPPIHNYDFSDFEPRHYHYMAAQGSSSCPNHCSFCNVANLYGGYRRKDPAQTVDEMIYMYKKYNCQVFYMTDALLNEVITDIADEVIRRDVSLYWDGYFRVSEICTREMALHWRRGGVYRARIGVETGSQRMLDLMGKAITVDQIKQNLANLAYAGIKTTIYIVIGHPGETETDFQKTLDLVEEMRSEIWEAECNPFLYYYSGQIHNDIWSEKRMLLYPEWAKDMLICQTWIVNDEPVREKFFHWIYRFVAHCKQLGISTPWSLKNVNQQDIRWKMLHQNAVPPFIDLIKKNKYIEDRKYVKELISARVIQQEDEFDF